MAASEKRVDQFLRLYHSHEVALRGIALSLIPRWADASEVIQEANLVMWQKFDEFEIGSNFQAWAGRIIQFKAKEFRRKQGRDQRIFTFLTDELSETLVEEASDLVGEFEERYPALQRCLSKLKSADRELLEIRYQTGSTIASVAEATGRSAEALYKTLSRLRSALLACVNRTLVAGGAK
jgi:RNA polymerase sigma-70 factor (ECF subfamily)